MTEFSVNSIAENNVEHVISLLHGDERARKIMVRKVLKHHNSPVTPGTRESARTCIEEFLDDVQDGERPLFSDWSSFSISDLEAYIVLVRDHFLMADNPYVREVMDTQWDRAHLYWVLKGGNHLKDAPLEGVDTDAF